MADRADSLRRYILLALVCLLAVFAVWFIRAAESGSDRTGEMGNEQGVLDRDVDDLEVDPRQEPAGPRSTG